MQRMIVTVPSGQMIVNMPIEYIPRIGEHIVLATGVYRVLDVRYMIDLNLPNVTVYVIKEEWE